MLIKKYTDLELSADFLLAEQMLPGVQVTVEGFCFNGEVTIMGITDSIMYAGTMSFERFEYPSRLPGQVTQRMEAIATERVSKIGLDCAMFNIEMFYDYESDAIHIVEINPRMSYQFADIFEKVDGANSYNIQLNLSQGQTPDFKRGRGRFGVAASFVLRLFEDKRVTRSPSSEEIRKAQALFPDAMIVIKVGEGNRLSDVSQDEHSYRYAIINLGGKDWTDLYSRFEDLNRLLTFEFSALPQASHVTPASTANCLKPYETLLERFRAVGFYAEREQMIRALKVFFEIVNKHEVRACIMFGTLLGKLRHDDFIPWDDDTDVIVFDYDEFLAHCQPELEQLGYTCEPDIRGSKRTGCRIFHKDGVPVPGIEGRRFPWIGVYEHELGEDGRILLPPEKARYLPEEFLPLKETNLLGITVGIPNDPVAVLNRIFGSEDWMEVCQLPYRDHRNGNVPSGFPNYKFELQRVLEYLETCSQSGLGKVVNK